MVQGLAGSKPLTDDQVTTDCIFAHDSKLGYVTALPKLINEFKIKIDLKVHESMESAGMSLAGGKPKKDGNKEQEDEENEDDEEDEEEEEEQEGFQGISGV